MMFVFFGLFVLLCIYKVQLRPKNGEKYMTDYMSVEKTMSIKGIFILIVFFSHFNSYVSFSSPAASVMGAVSRTLPFSFTVTVSFWALP